MSTDDTPDDFGDEPESPDDGSVRDRLEEETDHAVEGLDESLVELLSWVLDTETRARIYIYLRENPASTSDEIADGTGLYPSTVREALAELNGENKVTRGKREASGAGNNPYEYVAIPPAELVADIAGQVQEELNTVFNLDDRLADRTSDARPVDITVEQPLEERADSDD
ncbi:transcriptional regulator [Halobacteriales archaeon QS_5_70_17]|jgi:predicted transcriptional regulator|nr:MAG: transcriptional regulator [Halobacteriales archaeon QS_5_70_17]